MSTIPLSLLLVEDDPAQQRITVEFLRLLPSFTVEIDTAGSLEETKAKIQNHANRYDLILLDLGLPDSNGISTIEAVQALTDIKILVLTGSIMDQETLNRHEIKGYLNKTQLNLEALDQQIELTLEVDNCRKRRKKLERITSKLQKQIASSEVCR